MSSRMLVVLGVVGLVLGLAGAAQATLITGVTATASTEVGSWSPASRTTDNSGMSDAASPHTVNFSLDGSKPTHSYAYGDMWLDKWNETIANQWITFDLGSAQTVAEFAVWNYNESWAEDDRGTKTLYIWTSPDATGDTWTQQGGLQTFAKAPAHDTRAPGESFVLSSSWTNVRRVKFDIETNWGDGSHVGLSEGRFYTPEPATLALLGLGGLGMLLSRKRK